MKTKQLTHSLVGIQSIIQDQTTTSSTQPASGQTLSANPVKQQCLDNLSKVFNDDTLVDPPKAFHAYINDFCLNQLLEIPSKYFIINFHLKMLSKPLPVTTQDFSQQDNLPKRTQFVTELKHSIQEQKDFDSTCSNLLQNTQGLNSWFDPIDPMVSISQQEVCEIHKKLFNQLASIGISSLAEYVSFSYLVILDLYLNANQQEDYESCINAKVNASPKDTCLTLIKDHPVFSIWSSTQKSDICDEVASGIATAVAVDELTDGCAIQEAIIYKGYEFFINNDFSTVFQHYEKQIFASLEAENKKTKYSSSIQQQLSQTNNRSKQ
ncbi:UNKNOWN [Stylonychia lemnae]|uniref:Uncharacterized protein n=1 Tax=Stylonychia lemnae TaxID=5949 RepID=A0A077ZRV9_STYLE|nr:UNKNOWN [Stylonychia lemnae]|eukprot:CDW72095.1 UNKNOWN [Stylonychia lemnae]